MAYDLFFLSYNEPNADENWQKLSARFPRAKRINGVEGILAAHQACAKQALTRFFWVVDADSEVLSTFNFDYQVAEHQSEYVHLWYARNPTNALEYGWGGLKLFPRRKVLGASSMGIDMTMSFPLVIHPEVASITHYNCSPYDTWRSAFRECFKLTIAEQTEETASRLHRWMNSCSDAKNAHWSMRGACEGHEFAKVYLEFTTSSTFKNIDTTSSKIDIDDEFNYFELSQINDWKWLKERFKAMYPCTFNQM